MDLSTRDVARVLGLGQSGTARLLASGLVGEPTIRGRSHLYDRDAVHALAARPVLGPRTPLPEGCEDGVLVLRVDPRLNEIPARRLAVGRSAVLTVLLDRRGWVPLVISISGFVLAGHDVIGRWTDDAEPALTELALRDPGAWFSTFEDARLPIGAGDPLLWWRSRLCPPIPRDRPRRAA